MKSTQLIITILCLLTAVTVDAQILKKLMKRAEHAAERTILNRADREVSKTTDRAIDSILIGKEDDSQTIGETEKNTPNNGRQIKYSGESVNPALLINTEVKRQFYTTDIIVEMYQEGAKSQTFYFDADELAARNEFYKEEKEPMYFDSEGYTYSFNVKNERYEKSGFLKSGAMSMMIPTQLVESYKLPPEPFYEALEDFNEKGLRLNSFNVVEFAFIYKSEDFETDNYSKSTVNCGESSCTKFDINAAGYSGSYVLFNANDQLAEIYVDINGEQGTGAGKLKYYYEPCEVRIPPSTEVKMPGESLFNLGLDQN
ncbi:hypothetical protein [Arenibacter latericius]|uniref:hypothetical protein n=1 Tax=Arenibacter latericius TaxID=86104 RepID=UPI0012F945EA|nr:hypothetical protein [Arenibacter latericius]